MVKKLIPPPPDDDRRTKKVLDLLDPPLKARRSGKCYLLRRW